MKPLFPFYGSKWRDSRRYLAPTHRRVIEPFAGSGGYSLWHEPEHVTLIDIDPIIVGVWDYLTHVKPAEIVALPDLDPGQSTDDLGVPQEARWLIGFWLNRGSAQPKKTQTAYSRRTDRQQLVWGERARLRIAASLHAVAHWQIRHYRYSNVDHDQVGAWAKDLPGDVVVCEQAGATWLPFEPLASIKSTCGRSDEVAWTQRGSVP
jgi:hypothetical protein